MSEAAGRPSSGLWLYDATGGRTLPVAAVGALAGVATLCASLAGLVLLGGGAEALSRMPAFGPSSWAEGIVRALVLGYTVTLPAIGLRLAAQQLEHLEPHLERGGAAEGAVRDVCTVPFWSRWLGGLAGLVLLVSFGPAFIGPPGVVPLLTQLWFAVFGALLVRALAVHLHVARAFSRLGQRFLPVDLFDRRPFSPLVAWGLRIFLSWVVWFGLTSLFFVDPGPRPPNWSNLLGLVPLAVVGVGALLVPVWGIHGRLREAKAREIEQLDAAVRAERTTLWQDGPTDSPRLANLAGYRMLVADQSDWPLDVSAWLRFGFYLAIGAGSWIGAALVEQLLGRALA